MEKLLKKYYQMSDKEKKKIEELYILCQIQEQLENYKDEKISISHKKMLFKIIKKLLDYSNISIGEIIKRVMEILRSPDITVYEIDELDIKELIELLTVNENDFKEIESDYEIIKEFTYGSLRCYFIRDNGKYILVYEEDKISHVEIYSNFEEMLCYIIKNKLLTEGEKIGQASI